jgi:c-di-AMP phosphodiesterase-like protein
LTTADLSGRGRKNSSRDKTLSAFSKLKGVSWVQVWYFLCGCFFIAFLGLLVWHISQKRKWQVCREDLTRKINVVSESVLFSLPIGIVIIDQTGMIHWHNNLFVKMLGREGVIRGKIIQYLPELALRRHTWFPRWKTSQLVINNRFYQVQSMDLNAEDGINRLLLTFEDITEQVNLDRRFQEERPVIGVVQIDNFSEAFQGVDDEKRTMLLAGIDKELKEWVGKLEGVLKKFAEDRFLLVINQGILKECQKNRFEIVDRIREIGQENKVPVTLSIGMGVGEETLMDLARLAYLGLDLAQGRGGDQVVLKWANKVLYYGGKSSAPEKKTKVKARVVAYTLKHFIQEVANIVIMGHENSDLDSVGSSLGVARLALYFDKPVYLVLDNAAGTLDKFFTAVKDYPEYRQMIVTSREALQYTGKETLLVICDTHKPSLLIEPGILKKVKRVVVIDHHRRAEEFIDDAQLIYVEPYASSASELVTEIIQYMDEDISLNPLVASALLAGIEVDTKNFVFQTGVRTFEAAAFLRRSGADPGLVRMLLQDDYDTVLQRAQVVQSSEIWFGQAAVAIMEEAVPHSAVIAAKTADILLSVENVKVSFVIYAVPDGANISGRSNGDINVQVLLEQLGGGGHLNVAGAQLKGITVEDAKEKLKGLLQGYFSNQI